MAEISPTANTQLKRLPDRGAYDRKTIYAILDEASYVHLGFVVDDEPFVIPTIHGRKDDTLFLHGSAASRMLRNIQKGGKICVTATLMDGFVLARSAFHHSMNYRSVVALGSAKLLENDDEKMEGLRVISDKLLPGRWDDVRIPSSQELKATSVLSFPLSEASAKIRKGPPVDDDEDMKLSCWAGVLPVESFTGSGIPDEATKSRGIPFPEYLSDLIKK